MRLIVSLCLTACLFAQEFERRTFSAENNRLEHPIPVPDSILAKLAQDPGVTKLLSPGQKLPGSWFTAAETALKEGEHDVVLIGAAPILGANVTTFWVFGPQSDDYPLLLKVVAHTIEAKNDRSHDYRNIDAMSVAGASMKISTFKFDGKKYAHSKTKSTSLR